MMMMMDMMMAMMMILSIKNRLVISIYYDDGDIHPSLVPSTYNIHRSIDAFLTFSYSRYYVMNHSIDNMTKMTKASNMNILFRCHIKKGIFLGVKSIDHIEWNRTNLYHHPHHHQYFYYYSHQWLH